MSSVPAIDPARLPGPLLPRRLARRVAVAVIAALALAGLTWYALAGRAPAASPSAAADAGRALAAARARAVELARAKQAAPSAAGAAPAERHRSTRVADAPRAADLFAAHTWYVPPPPPPPAPAAPPAAPTAPAFPYTFVGSFTPDGAPTVYFLARGDRVSDAHVGDRIDGVYAFESATAAGLVFNYLPLDVRQTVPTGAPP